MAHISWHVYGYGICTDTIKTTPEKIENLLIHAPKLRERIHESFKDYEINTPSVDDYTETVEELFENCCGVATLLKAVILEAEDLGLVACDDYDCSDFLVFTPEYPWQMTEIERSMTEEKLNEIFRKYVNILTDAVIEIDNQTVENGG